MHYELVTIALICAGAVWASMGCSINPCRRFLYLEACRLTVQLRGMPAIVKVNEYNRRFDMQSTCRHLYDLHTHLHAEKPGILSVNL
jgi:hypothetical protein